MNNKFTFAVDQLIVLDGKTREDRRMTNKEQPKEERRQEKEKQKNYQLGLEVV